MSWETPEERLKRQMEDDLKAEHELELKKKVDHLKQIEFFRHWGSARLRLLAKDSSYAEYIPNHGMCGVSESERCYILVVQLSSSFELYHVTHIIRGAHIVSL